MRARILGLALVLVFASAAAVPPAGAEGTGRIAITPTIDPPGEVSDQALPTGSRYKVRDADGNVVAEGGIGGSGGNRGNFQTEYVDLPPGEYTVEVYYHSAGERHAEGTRDYKGTRKLDVSEGKTQATEVEVEPRNPEQHLSDQIQHQEDNLAEAEEAVKELEDDIARHRENGEPVGREHTDLLDDRNDDVDAIKDRLRRMRRQLRDMRAERLRRNAAGKAAADGAKKIRIPTGGQKGGKY
jgi:hypothetical protein